MYFSPCISLTGAVPGLPPLDHRHMSHPITFRALRIFEEEDGFYRRIVTRQLDELPAGEVLVRVHYSALNYKDALSATGNKGVSRHYPHTPGIDAAGVVVDSQDPAFGPGDQVIVTSYDLGMNTDGGFAEYIRVPAGWVVPLPAGLNLAESMILGTAGFTAGLALYKMERAGLRPGQGPVVVTGASGGVGSLAIAILARAGYEAIAATGSPEAHDWLRRLGAAACIDRSHVQDDSGRPLLRPRWAGAIDTVGGDTLATLLKTTEREGSVAACGLVASPQLHTTVFPFILNGVNLLGVESATCEMETRLAIWQRLASTWRIDGLDLLAQPCTLDELPGYIDPILAGHTRGRILVHLK